MYNDGAWSREDFLNQLTLLVPEVSVQTLVELLPDDGIRNEFVTWLRATYDNDIPSDRFVSIERQGDPDADHSRIETLRVWLRTNPCSDNNTNALEGPMILEEFGLGCQSMSASVTNSYEQPKYDGAEALLKAIQDDNPDVLGPMIIPAALYEDDFDIVHGACVQLSMHRDEVVRGNAILGFGHLARLFGRLGDEAATIVKRGLVDSSSYVRGQAYAAAGDLHHFLGTVIREPDPDQS